MGMVAGILIVFMGFAHTIYGEKKQIPNLRKLTKDPIVIGSLRIMIYQGGVLLLTTGLIQLLVSINAIQLVGIASYFPVGILLINLVTSFVFAISIHREILKITIPQFVVFTVIILLQILSI